MTDAITQSLRARRMARLAALEALRDQWQAALGTEDEPARFDEYLAEAVLMGFDINSLHLTRRFALEGDVR